MLAWVKLRATSEWFALFALSPPLAVFVFGLGIWWIGRGFSSNDWSGSWRTLRGTPMKAAVVRSSLVVGQDLGPAPMLVVRLWLCPDPCTRP